MPDQHQPSAQVRTNLVHRRTRVPGPWWQSCTIIDSPIRLSSPDDACLLGEIAGDTGFDAYVLRPDVEELADPSSPLALVCRRLKSIGLKVIIRIPEAAPRSILARGDEGVEALLSSVRRAAECGADGVDLGECREDAATVPEAGVGHADRGRFSALIRRVQAELTAEAAEATLSFGVIGHDLSDIRMHLEEEWFHHLRDDSLSGAPWCAERLIERAVEALRIRDPLGAVMAWSLHAGDPTTPVESRSGTTLALVLFALSLPGAVQLEVDIAGLDAAPAAASRSIVVSDPVARALALRAEHGLGTGSLGVVSGLAWTHEGASVHVNGPVLIVLNTSDEEVRVPGDARLLVSSSQTSSAPDGATAVPPSTCAWFETPRVRPAVASYWD